MSKESDTFQTIGQLGAYIIDNWGRTIGDADNWGRTLFVNLTGQLGTYIICQLDDTVHEMARDEARHGKAFEGLLNRYFK